MIKSYAKVGRSVTETHIHKLGKKSDGSDLFAPVPIPLMGLVWFGASFVVLLVISGALGIAGLPRHAASGVVYVPVVFFHLGLPILIAYIMTMAEVEGRRIHVVLAESLREMGMKHCVGGYLPTSDEDKKIRYRNIQTGRHRNET